MGGVLSVAYNFISELLSINGWCSFCLHYVWSTKSCTGCGMDVGECCSLITNGVVNCVGCK